MSCELFVGKENNPLFVSNFNKKFFHKLSPFDPVQIALESYMQALRRLNTFSDNENLLHSTTMDILLDEIDIEKTVTGIELSSSF